MKNLALYIHWPFCKSKCPYCDFNSHVRSQLDIVRWSNAYLKEITYYKNFLAKKNITSIFFGGGTPSLMPISLIDKILSKLNEICNFDNNIEITLEANPTSIEMEKFNDLAKIGINRVSIGIQSFNEHDLKFLGREHSATEALKAIEIADKYFTNFSFDLIYALPNQTYEKWERELTFALEIAKYHISLYQLTIEKGTRFYSDYINKKFELPSDEEGASLYELTCKLTSDKGFIPYEISNYAKLNYESKHNLTYWLYEEYLGLGAGAHGRINMGEGLKALMNFHLPEKWLLDIENNGSSIQNSELLKTDAIAEEYMLMSLRLDNGINKKSFEEKTGKHLENFLNKDKIKNLVENNFLINSSEKIALTAKGKLLFNQVIKFLL